MPLGPQMQIYYILTSRRRSVGGGGGGGEGGVSDQKPISVFPGPKHVL